jgi:hypothetical protein
VLHVSTDKCVAASILGFIAVSDTTFFIMAKCLIKKKEVKMQPESTTMTVSSVDIYKTIRTTCEGKKDKNSKEVR